MTPRRAVPPGHAFCPDCREVKPVDAFPTNPSTSTGRGAYCHPCHNVRCRRYTIANHGSTRSYHLKRRYDLTEAEVDAMVAAQDGLCALCRRKPAEHVDHCHLTGQVRGVLCFTCNVGLGNFADSEHLLRHAADYLRGHQTTDPSVIDDGAEWDFSEGYTTGA